MSSHSVLLVLTHIQAWEDPCGTLRHFQVSRNRCQKAIMEHCCLDTISMTTCSRQVHQTQHSRAFKCRTNPGRIDGGNTIRSGMVFESHHCKPFPVVATLVLLAHQMAKRSHTFLTKPRNMSSPTQSQWAKEYSLLLQCDITRAHR